MQPFHVSVEQDGASVVLRASGDLDHAVEQELSSYVEQVIPMASGGEIALDASGVTFLDSSGLRCLVLAHERCRASAIRFVLRAPSQPVVRVLGLAGVDQALIIDP